MKRSHKLLAAAGSLTLVSAAAGQYFHHRFVKRVPDPRTRDELLEPWTSMVNPNNISCWEIQSFDDLQLKAYYFKRPERSHKYAILVHGYHGRGLEMTDYGRGFYQHGYNLLVPDLRGHGESEGHYIGFGWHDHMDVIRWIYRLIEEDPAASIALFGLSMGAATVMMVSGDPLPPNVKCIIEDCGYTSAWAECAEQLHVQYKLPPFPVLSMANLMMRFTDRYTLRDANAIRQVAKSITPMLFIHGEEDTFVPYDMLAPLYETATCEKQKLSIPGAGHAQCVRQAPELYWKTIRAFLDKYID